MHPIFNGICRGSYSTLECSTDVTYDALPKPVQALPLNFSLQQPPLTKRFDQQYCPHPTSIRRSWINISCNVITPLPPSFVMDELNNKMSIMQELNEMPNGSFLQYVSQVLAGDHKAGNGSDIDKVYKGAKRTCSIYIYIDINGMKIVDWGSITLYLVKQFPN